jgi:hypothetical protein
MLVATAGALFLATVLVGCSGGDDVPDTTPVVSEEVTATANTLTEEELAAWGMSVTDKQTRFEPEFPWQAPVIDGEITVAEVDGAGTHFYRIELGRPVSQVAEWYLRSYPNANWIVHDTRTNSENGIDTTVIEVTKGAGAWSRVLIEGDEESAIVEASVGVGSPPEGVF